MADKYELIQAGEHTYYLDTPSKIGIVKTGKDEVVLIDSGHDQKDGALVIDILRAHGWSLAAIFNTHSHADHIGGNAILQAATGCPIYAPGIECDFVNHPILETAYFYGGFPPAEIRRTLFLAEESEAKPLTQDVLPDGWEMISLPGHWFDMVGFRTQDDIVFLADLVMSERAMQSKSRIPYLVDAESYLSSLEMVKEMDARLFIPAHSDPVADIRDVLQANIDKIHEITDCILSLLKEPLPFEKLLQALFKHYGMKMDMSQYVLIGSTLRSYLAWLEHSGEVSYFAKDDLLFWQCTDES